MKSKLIIILAIFTILLISCGTERPSDDEMPLVEIYSLALEALMEEDKALNDDMAFIAIDLSNFENLNKTARQAIIDYFSDKYSIDVMDSTFEELREKGFFNEDTMVLDGVLLRMEKVDITSTKVVFTGSKYRSGLGAIGMEVTLRNEDGKWKVTESKMIWIARRNACEMVKCGRFTGIVIVNLGKGSNDFRQALH